MVWAARLAAVPEVRAVERERFQAVLLDEYQDTGHAQIALLSGLFDDGHLVMAVGDPFQSIYSWRGASAGNINRFDQTFRRARRESGANLHPVDQLAQRPRDPASRQRSRDRAAGRASAGDDAEAGGSGGATVT